jgi:hypothetical protein
MRYHLIPTSHNRLILKWFTLILIFGSCAAHAQFSVAPSQTGRFFNDLRQRSAQFRDAAGVQERPSSGSQGVYDYTRGEYLGDESGRGLGEQGGMENPENEAYRALGQQGYRSGYVGQSKRSSGDYTNVSGPYPASSTFFAPTYVSDPFLRGKRNVKLGPVSLGFGLNTNVEYNDNITQVQSDKLSDVIAGVYLSVDAIYPITQNNQLTLNTVVGIDRYFNHPEISPNGNGYLFNVAPGTSIAFDMRIGKVNFVFYDRISVRPQTQDSFALDSKNSFGNAQNDAGVGINWAINSKLNLSLNYNRSDSRALQDIDERFNRSVNSVSASLAYSPGGTWTVGAEGSYSKINYIEGFNNDGTTLSGGIFLILPITKNTILKASAGYQDFQFDTAPVFNRTVTGQTLVNIQAQVDLVDQQIALFNAETLTDTDPAQRQITLAALEQQKATFEAQLASARSQKTAEDVFENGHSLDNNSHYGGFYYNVAFTNQLNARVNQNLTFGRESSLNTTSNYLTSDYVTYGLGFILWRGARLNLSGYFENSAESGGRLAEDVQQAGFDIALSHKLTDYLTLGLGYHYGENDSSMSGRSFTQQAYSVDLTYAVSRKMSIGLGYRFLATDSEFASASFEQNRILMTMNYNF